MASDQLCTCPNDVPDETSASLSRYSPNFLLYRIMDTKELLSSTDSFSRVGKGVLVCTPFHFFSGSHAFFIFWCMMNVEIAS